MTRDTLGRGLMWLLVVLTLAAFADGLRRMAAGSDRIGIETWRTFAYIVFGGLFVIIAWRPQHSPGVWELVFAHKSGVVLYGLTLGDVPEAPIAIVVDTVLVVVMTASWWLTRGWKRWKSARTEQSHTCVIAT